jgi:hypothetical protein
MRRYAKHVAGSVLTVFFLSSAAFAFQFESYEWNDTLSQIKKEVEKRENHILSLHEDTLVYTDTVLREPCKVSLFFDPDTTLLKKITVKWETTSVGARLLERFTQKYGRPFQPNFYAKRYIWKNPSRYGIITLDYTIKDTTLVYYGDEYYRPFQEHDKGNKGNITW